MAGAVCLPRRDFRAAHQWVEAALALEARPADRLRAVVVRHVTAVLLGGAATARDALRDAAAAAEAAGEQALQWRLLGMRVLVAHDLGDPEFEALWRRLEQRVTSGHVDEMVPELAAIGLRVLAEREELDRAITMSAHLALAGGQSWPLLTHLARLARRPSSPPGSATTGRPPTCCARSSTRAGAPAARCSCPRRPPASSCSRPSTTAPPRGRPSRSTTRSSAPSSADRGRSSGDGCRAPRCAPSHGDAEGAAAACGQASSLAAKHGLQVLAARARHSRTDYLRATGVVRSRRATTRARSATPADPRRARRRARRTAGPASCRARVGQDTVESSERGRVGDAQRGLRGCAGKAEVGADIRRSTPDTPEPRGTAGRSAHRRPDAPGCRRCPCLRAPGSVHRGVVRSIMVRRSDEAADGRRRHDHHRTRRAAEERPDDRHIAAGRAGVSFGDDALRAPWAVRTVRVVR